MTPDAAQALQTAQAGFDSYKDAVFDEVHMSESDYLRLWAKPQVARQKVRDALVANIGQTADQVHAEHILVATEELANQIYADVTTGYGPECFTIRLPKDKRAYPYTLQAHYYSIGPMGAGMGKLEIIEHDGKGGLRFEERPYVVMVNQAFVDLGTVTK